MAAQKDDFFRFLLLGKTGTGKSTTGNTIFGKKFFNTSVSFSSDCERRVSERRGQKIEIMDCPGLYDPNKTHEEISTMIIKAVAAMYPGPNAVLYVVRIGRYTAEEFGAYTRIKALFDDAITKHMIVLFTGGDTLEQSGETMEELLKTQTPKDLRTVLEDCEGRYAVFNNKASDPNLQVERLLQQVRKMVKANHNKPYACPRYAFVGDTLEEEVTRRMKEVEKKDLGRQLQRETREAEEMAQKAQERFQKKEEPRKKQLKEEEERIEILEAMMMRREEQQQRIMQDMLAEMRKQREEKAEHERKMEEKMKQMSVREQERMQEREEKIRKRQEEMEEKMRRQQESYEQEQRQEREKLRSIMEEQKREKEELERQRKRDRKEMERRNWEYDYEERKEEERRQRKKGEERFEEMGEKVMEKVKKDAVKEPEGNFDDCFRFLLLGKTGTGKSTTGNIIFGKKLFGTSISFSSVTADCERKVSERRGQKIEIMDCPGLYDTTKSHDQISLMIIQAVAGMYPGPHAVLYVVRIGRYTDEEFGAYTRLKALFDNAITKHMIVIFTHGDTLEQSGETMEELLKKTQTPKDLRTVLEDCEGRYAVFNNNASDPNLQVERLLQQVREMVKANHNKPYACPRYAFVGDTLEEEVTRRMKEVEKKDLGRQRYVQQLQRETREAEEMAQKAQEQFQKNEEERKNQLQEEEERRMMLETKMRRQEEQQQRIMQEMQAEAKKQREEKAEHERQMEEKMKQMSVREQERMKEQEERNRKRQEEMEEKIRRQQESYEQEKREEREKLRLMKEEQKREKKEQEKQRKRDREEMERRDREYKERMEEERKQRKKDEKRREKEMEKVKQDAVEKPEGFFSKALKAAGSLVDKGINFVGNLFKK